MLTRTDRRRFPVLLAVIAALAMAMLFSPVQAQEGSAPDKPRGLEATATHDSVTLTWDDPQDDSITGYVILRRIPGVDPQGHFNELVADTGTDATTYTDDTVSAETRYTYRIKAINGAGTSERSRWFHINVPAAPEPEEEQAAEPPDKPRGLEATATHDSVTLTWDDPGDDSITGYVVLRRIPGVDPQGHFNELVSNTGTDATTYTDDTVSAETRYTYRIKAINGAGTSERSRWSHVDVPAAPEAAEGDDPDGEGDGGGAPGQGAPGGPGKKANVSEPDGEDLPEGTTTTGEVDVGGSVTGNIDSNDDEDWFKVVLEAGTRYQIDLEGADTGRGTLPDPFLDIRSAAAVAVLIQTADDTGVGLNSRVIYAPTAAGAHYVQANTASGTGTYTLSMIVLGANGNSEADTDFPETTATTGRVEVGASATGNIDRSFDQDWFRLDLEAGKTYQIDLEGDTGGGGTLGDPYLRNIRDSSGTEISGTENDDIVGGVADSRVVFTPTADGAYYLVASGFDGTYTGTYTLSVTELETRTEEGDTDFANDVTTLGRVEVGGSATGEIENVADGDWFRVVLEKDKTYVFDLEGTETSSGTLADPILLLRDASGSTLEGDDDGGDGANSRLEYTATADGIHYLTATTATSATSGGTYTLSVREVLPCTLNEGDIWCGVVDVEEVRSTANVLTGHGFVGITGRETGGLAGHPDDTMFSVGDNDYTIQGIYVGTGTNNEGALFLLLTANLSDDDEGILVLAFDGVTTLRPLDDATKLSTGLYHWSTVLDWSSTTEVTVRLQTPSDDADDPPVVLPTLSIGNASGAEGSITLFPLTLSAAASGDVTVTCTASFESGDTAAAADLAALVSPATIQAGSTTGQCATVFAQDTIDENNETFTVTLSGVSSNAQLAADPTAKGTILDDDDPPVDDSETEEEDLAADTSTTGTVEVGGAAVRGDIYEPVEETVTWTIIDADGDEVEKEGTVYDFDTDWFAVDLKAGRTYRIDMKGETPDDDLTLHLPEIHAIYDADGVDLPNTSSRDATDDANSSHHLARVEFTPEDDGTYYIAASGESFEWGDYELTVIDITQDDDEHPADRSTTVIVIVGTPVTGKIDFNRDVDWFKLLISVEDRYQIDLEGQETGSGSLRDPLLLGVYDADGNYISGTRNDDGGEGYNARISRTLKVGIYYVAVGAFGNGEGTYTLTVVY